MNGRYLREGPDLCHSLDGIGGIWVYNGIGGRGLEDVERIE